MKKKHIKHTVEEMAEGQLAIHKIDPNLEHLTLDIVYSGITFTVAAATLTIPYENVKTSKIIIGEGICKKGFEDKEIDEIRSYNIAGTRAIEAIDKKIRRSTGYIGHKYEG